MLALSHLMQKGRETKDAQKAMEQQKEDLESTLLALRLQKDDLKGKEEHTKHDLHKFDNFLQRHEEKHCQAMRTVTRERELINQKEADIKALQQEMKSLIKERDQLQKHVNKNAFYRTFVDKIVKASDQFQEIHQVMSQYETLTLTREELLRITRQNQESIEKCKAQLSCIKEQGTDTVLHCSNTLTQLQNQLDKAQADVIIWESRWAHIQNTAAEKTILLGTIKMATLDLYQSLCKRARDTGKTSIAPEDTFKQLEKIQTLLSELIYIWEELSNTESALTGHD
ncbi:coiled-coil domain-containing protein 42-like isoform X2 [Hoplias malabaricus]